jgi:hypothetical protein
MNHIPDLVFVKAEKLRVDSLIDGFRATLNDGMIL